MSFALSHAVDSAALRTTDETGDAEHRLRARYAATAGGAPHPHDGGVAVAPPTVTGASGAPAAPLNAFYRWTDSQQAARYLGGRVETYATSFRRFPVANRDAATIERTGCWRVEAMVDSGRLAVQVLGHATNAYRFLVDGRYASLAGHVPGTGGGSYYFTLDFASAGGRASRHIAVEGERDLGFAAFIVSSLNGESVTLTTPAAPLRAMFFGDSHIEGTGATLKGDGLAIVAADALGLGERWASGVGGTGFWKKGADGTRYRLSERVADVNLYGPWDAVFVSGGVNDAEFFAAGTVTAAAYAAEVNACLGALRAANPRAVLYVVGPWDRQAPAAPAAGYAAAKDAIVAACAGRAGVHFLDPQGVAYSKSDVLHPDTAGHRTLGLWLAGAVRALG